MPGARFDQDVGSPSFQRVIQVTAVPLKVVLLGSRYKSLELHNADTTNTIFFGDSTVTSATGMPFFPGDFRFFKGAHNAFQIWLVCAAGLTAMVNICEYP